MEHVGLLELVGLFVIVIAFFHGWNHARKKHLDKMSTDEGKPQVYRTIPKGTLNPTSLGLVCQRAKKCDITGCDDGTEYRIIKCPSCIGISDDSLWIKPCQKCNNSRVVQQIANIPCKRCEGIGFLSYGSHFQVADADFSKEMNWDDSINACRSLGGGWRLPTEEEIRGMFVLHKQGKGGFTSDDYWYECGYQSELGHYKEFGGFHRELYVDKKFEKRVRAVFDSRWAKRTRTVE